ncbi:hypothetical protein P692DRAFT_201871846 [Suillus brevipes Sb2]|nr:hypothetical protein P692DRAFT_201871846 [Suillus brevipes Sb2]
MDRTTENRTKSPLRCFEKFVLVGTLSCSATSGALQATSFKRRKKAGHIPLKKEREKEQMSNTTTGDICGGQGGELGRRLEAWLSVNGNWGWEEEYDAEAE